MRPVFILAVVLILLVSSCTPPRPQRELSQDLRPLTPMQRFRFAEYLSYKISLRGDVIAAKVFLHAEHEQGDYIIVRLIPEPEIYTDEAEKEIRLWIYHQTNVPPPFIKVVRVREI